MQPPRRRWRVVLGLLFAALLGMALLLRTERAGTLVCEQLRERLPALLDADVEVGRCAIDPLTASVEVSRVLVTAHGASGPLLAAEKAGLSLRGFFFGGISLQDVELVRPRVTLQLPLGGARVRDPAPCASSAGCGWGGSR